MNAMVELQPDAIREVVDCPYCDSGARHPVTDPIPDGECHNLVEPWQSMRFQMVACEACGTHYQRIRPRREDIGQFYDGEYACYESLLERGPIVRYLARLSGKLLLRRIEAHRPASNNHFLDYGCGSGTWMELLASIKAPWQMTGTEISQELVEQVEARGFPGRVADDSNIDRVFEPASLGVIHMNHVIEHVQNPRELLAKLYSLLVPGGIVVGQTPDHGCLERRIFGNNWAQWHLPRHLVLFDKPTLRKFAEAAGFEVLALESSPSGAVIWGGSLLKWWAKLRRRPYLATKERLHPWLMLLFAPIALIQSKLGSTSHMDFTLRKPG